MRMLVTGGSGFIGSHVVDKLIDSGHSIRVLDIKSPHRNDVEFIKGSITSKTDITKAVDNVEIIYHIAAFSNINLVKESPVMTIESNIMGTAYLLDEARKRNIRRFLFASSVYVHDKRGHLYTTSKLASEMLCKNYYTLYSLPYTILRYGTAYGRRSRAADVISIFVEKALKNKEITIFGTGSQKRNFINVEDIASGSVAALKEIGENKTYVIAGLQAVSIKELADIIKKVFDFDVTINIDAYRKREDDYQGEIRGVKETMAELNWKPEINLEKGIKNYRDWYMENGL